ncbi:hypothetical protein, partial [Bacillus thuringiensis]|uniref:hypothetical protein n=1 Tax=Bacillus thuringiensis TaxID=1428 RepID=UPI0014322D24
YSYRIMPGLIKQKQLPVDYRFYNTLSSAPQEENFHHSILTQGEIDSLWQRYLYVRSASEDLFRNAQVMKTGNGRLQLGLTKDSSGREPFVRNLFLFRYDDPDFLRIYPGMTRDLGYLQPGAYRLLLLLPQDMYAVVDSIAIKK